MNNGVLIEHLKKLHEVILEERRAAKALAVDRMLEMTEIKECLLKQMQPLVDSVDELTATEKDLAEAVNSENLRNAYFFLSALKWVRESMGFIGDKIYPECYGESGRVIKGRFSGTLLSGRV